LRSVEKPEEVLAVSSNGGAEPLWSPDGKELFYRRGDAFLVVSVNAAGALAVGNERKLLEMQRPFSLRSLPLYAFARRHCSPLENGFHCTCLEVQPTLGD